MNTSRLTRTRWPKGAWMKPKCQIIHAMLANSPHTYEAVGRYVGCSKQMIGHLAKDPRKTCTPALASKLAVFLGVPVEALFEVCLPTSASQREHKKTAVAA